MSTKRGFTLIELMIVISVSAILATLLFGPLNDLLVSNYSGLRSITQVADTRVALRSIENDISLSGAFYDTNQINDPRGPNNNGDGTQWKWDGTNSGGGSTSRVMITGSYATNLLTSQDTSGDRTLVNTSDCSTPLMNNTVYFVKSGTLYRRTIKNTSATCDGTSMAQKQTCAAGDTNAACQGVDATIITGVTNFTVDYYAAPYSTTPMTSEYTDSFVPSMAGAVGISLTVQVGTGSSATSSSSSLRIARLNGVSPPFPVHAPGLTTITTTGPFHYTIPSWANYIDVIIIGAGGGGSSGNSFFTAGNGGRASTWKTATLHRGVDISWGVTAITGLVGAGGRGGVGDTVAGAAGANSTVSAAGWAGLTSSGGAGAAGNGAQQNGFAPGNKTFNSQVYTGGVAGTGNGGDGAVPGAGGAGGDGGAFGNVGNGGDGARGGAWFYAYQ